MDGRRWNSAGAIVEDAVCGRYSPHPWSGPLASPNCVERILTVQVFGNSICYEIAAFVDLAHSNFALLI